MQHIDASKGEGGGQAVRTALMLAALTRQEVEIVNIRRDRRQPGLRSEHIAAARALAKVSDGRLQGDSVGSQTLRFAPGLVQSSSFELTLGDATAGFAPVGHVLTALAPVLARSGRTTEVVLHGTTHVPNAPSVTYLQTVFLPSARKLGLRAEISTETMSWDAHTPGTVRVRVEPTSVFRAVDLTDRGGIVQIGGISLVSGPDGGTTERMRNRALRRLSEVGRSAQIQTQSVQSATPGAMLFLLAIFERAIAGFQAIVVEGGTAEQAADVAVEDLFAYLPAYAVLDKYLVDQLLIYAALADGESTLSTCELTAHALTTAELIRHFLPIRTRLQGLPGQAGEIGVTVAAHHR